MISIHSAEENEFIRNYVKEQPSSSTRVWIGLKRDSSASHQFVWVDKSPVDYDNWRINEPSNAGGNEDYTEMMIYKNGTWKDDTDNNHEFVCGFNCKLSMKFRNK